MLRMMSRHLIAVLLTSTVAMQFVDGHCLVTGGRTEGAATAGGVHVPCPLTRSFIWLAMKRAPVDGQMQRMWLSRGSTSSLMHQLLDPTELLGKDSDSDSAVDGSRSMRYGR